MVSNFFRKFFLTLSSQGVSCNFKRFFGSAPPGLYLKSGGGVGGGGDVFVVFISFHRKGFS